MRRALLTVLLVLALPAAAPAGILALEDAQELANTLADAQAEQDVCYGWWISNDFDFSADMGSSSGGPGAIPTGRLGTPPAPGNCERYVLLTGSIHYACESCEDSDSADVEIESNLVPAPTTKDLEDLGLGAGGLTGDNDDVTLINMVGALPLLAAQSGAVPALAAEIPASVPAADVPTNAPGSDFLREAWLKLIVFLLLLACGPVLWWYKRGQTAAADARESERRELWDQAAAARESSEPKET